MLPNHHHRHHYCHHWRHQRHQQHDHDNQVGDIVLPTGEENNRQVSIAQDQTVVLSCSGGELTFTSSEMALQVFSFNQPLPKCHNSHFGSN